MTFLDFFGFFVIFPFLDFFREVFISLDFRRTGETPWHCVDGMAADLATAIVKEMRAGDGDLDAYVLIVENRCEYKLQPAIRNGALKWEWHGMLTMVPSKWKVVFDDLDDVVDLLQVNFPKGFYAKLWSYEVGGFGMDYWCKDYESNNSLKKFFMRCPKIEIIKP